MFIGHKNIYSTLYCYLVTIMLVIVIIILIKLLIKIQDAIEFLKIWNVLHKKLDVYIICGK